MIRRLGILMRSLSEKIFYKTHSKSKRELLSSHEKSKTMKKLSLVLVLCLISVLLVNSQTSSFTPELLWKLKRLSGGILSPNENYVLYKVTSIDVEKEKGSTDIFIYDTKAKKTFQLNSPFLKISQPRWMSNYRIAFTERKENEVEIASVNVFGGDRKVHGVLPKTTLDYKFSPKENYLVALQRVKTRPTLQEQYSDLPKANAIISDDLMYRHWDTWKDEYNTQLFLYGVSDGNISENGKNLILNEPFDAVMPPFSGMEEITFSTDEEYVLYATKKMNGNDFATSTNSEIYAYHIPKGTTENWTKGYIGYDTHPTFSPNGEYFSWLSMKRDGFESDKNDIIIRDLKSKEDINLTEEIDLTVSSFSWSPDSKTIYFIAVTNATYQVFEYDLKKRKYEQLTDGIFNYNSLSIGAKEIYATRQSMLVPTDLFSISRKKGEAEQLTDVNEDLLDDLPKPTVEKRWITTSDNKKMLTWVILPPNFDESKKYPSLLYCQGGPQSAVSQFFSYRWNFRLMAEQGYVVIAPNRRGLPGFGQEWNDAISKDWGGQPMRDYIAAVDEVKKEKYIDANRIGAVGASYGGFSVYYLAGMHEGRFSSFISHCGLFNMTSWYGSTEELFFANWELGGPYWKEENKTIYENNSPHHLVANWDTPILVIHGGKDYRVPDTQGLEAFQAAKIKGIKSRLLYFPDENHWILQPQNALLWQREFYKWLDETLTK